MWGLWPWWCHHPMICRGQMWHCETHTLPSEIAILNPLVIVCGKNKIGMVLQGAFQTQKEAQIFGGVLWLRPLFGIDEESRLAHWGTWHQKWTWCLGTWVFGKDQAQHQSEWGQQCPPGSGVHDLESRQHWQEGSVPKQCSSSWITKSTRSQTKKSFAGKCHGGPKHNSVLVVLFNGGMLLHWKSSRKYSLEASSTCEDTGGSTRPRCWWSIKAILLGNTWLLCIRLQARKETDSHLDQLSWIAAITSEMLMFQTAQAIGRECVLPNWKEDGQQNKEAWKSVSKAPLRCLVRSPWRCRQW